MSDKHADMRALINSIQARSDVPVTIKDVVMSREAARIMMYTTFTYVIESEEAVQVYLEESLGESGIKCLDTEGITKLIQGFTPYVLRQVSEDFHKTAEAVLAEGGFEPKKAAPKEAFN